MILDRDVYELATVRVDARAFTQFCHCTNLHAYRLVFGLS